MKYYLVKIIHNDIDHYLIWYNGEEDGFLLFQQQLCVFCSVEKANEFADKEQIRFETETAVFDLTNLIELIKHTESSQNCRTLIDTWHFFSDLSKSRNEKFLGDVDEEEIIDIYKKLFYGSNIKPLKNEEYHPSLNEDEENKCSEIFQSGLSILNNLGLNSRRNSSWSTGGKNI